jgi:ribonuclease BN (tRNA processing enzyme)
MKLIVGGPRGTNPVSQPEFLTYGGETTSYLVEGHAGERVLIDAGTGIRTLGHRMEMNHPSATVLLLITHYHLDHVMGLPALPLIYKKRWTIEMASPVRHAFRVEEVMPRLFNKPLWPLQVEDLASHVRFKTLEGSASHEPLEYGSLRIRWCSLHHPGGCTAYRIDEPSSGASCVIATDLEWSESSASEQEHLLQLCDHASLLVMDGQFTPADYEQHRGWGHSTWKDCADVAGQAGVRQLIVSHHSPACDDHALHHVEKALGAYSPGALLARQGMVLVPDARKRAQAPAPSTILRA